MVKAQMKAALIGMGEVWTIPQLPCWRAALKRGIKEGSWLASIRKEPMMIMTTRELRAGEPTVGVDTVVRSSASGKVLAIVPRRPAIPTTSNTEIPAVVRLRIAGISSARGSRNDLTSLPRPTRRGGIVRRG
jgi:hypothetical protein